MRRVSVEIAVDLTFIPRQPGESRSVIWVRLERVLKVSACRLQFFGLVGKLDQCLASQVGVVSLRILRVTMPNGLLLLRTEFEVERIRNLQRSLFLQRKNVLHFSSEVIGPHLEPGG